MKNTTEILKKLISIESVTGNEKPVMDWIESLLRPCVGAVKREGNNLVWKSPEWDLRKQTIALGAHLDTVPFESGDWAVTRPCVPLEQDGKIYGRGSCDMKGGASIILSLILNQDLGKRFNVMAFFTDKEEIGAPNGVTELIELGYFENVDFCVVPEPTEQKIVHGIFANLDGIYTAQGKAAHSSDPTKGRNAIYELLPIIEKLRDVSLSNLEGVSESLSVNIIEGGVATNVIPDFAKIQFDHRYDPSKDGLQLLSFFRSLETENVRFEGDFLPGLSQTIEEGSLLAEFSESLEVEGIVPFWSDIAQIGAKGVPSINYGPGSIKQAHQADEFVPVQDLEDVYETFRSFLQ